MAEGVSEAYLQEIAKLVASHFGLHFSRERWGDLNRALTRAAPELGFEDPVCLAQWLLQSPFQDHRIEALIGHLTIGETHFFRDEKLFQVLEAEILQELISSRTFSGRQMRIWSAGCATGEEPYSIAIVLSKLIPDFNSWNIVIQGTDVNRRFLKKAQRAVYSQWSFRAVAPDVIGRYFRQKREGSELLSELRRMVTFGYLNLVKDPFPISAGETCGIDLILCRNVLMYFTEACQEQVVKRFCECLPDGGWLIVTPAEASIIADPRLVQQNRGGVILFRKGAKKKARTESRLRFSFDVSVQVPELHSAPVQSAQPLPCIPDKALKPAPAPHPPGPSDTEPICEGKSSPYREALAVYEVGDYAEVAARLETLLADPEVDLGERCASMTLLSKAYANLGKLEEAIEWTERAVTMDKLNPRSHYFHGSILQEQGRLQDAVSAMGKAVFLDPNLVVAHFALGNLLRKLGKSKESDRHFRTALVILGKYGENDMVPASDGLTAGRLTDIIVSTTQKEGKNARR